METINAMAENILMEYRNPMYNTSGSIDCEVDHPIHGWIPFTAAPNDIEAHGRELYERILAAGKEHIAPAPEPDSEAELQEWREHFSVSAFQAKAALTIAGYMPEITAIMDDPQTDPMIVLAWQPAQTFERSSPNINELAELLEITPEQLDDLFRYAATIRA